MAGVTGVPITLVHDLDLDLDLDLDHGLGKYLPKALDQCIVRGFHKAFSCISS